MGTVLTGTDSVANNGYPGKRTLQRDGREAAESRDKGTS